jgi:TPR repeat protein
VRRDRVAALRWYRNAARRGGTQAQINLARYYLDGEGVRSSTRWARHWLRRAARAGSGEARRLLDEMG